MSTWKKFFLPMAIGSFLLINHSLLMAQQTTQSSSYLFNDSHFHLTNYIQEGTEISKFLEIMGDKVGRVALFGIPLQQMHSYDNSGSFRPTYYLQSDAPLYYYSFTDAFIAMAYKSLSSEQQKRFDPMITGFNPADMYGVDHIRRVLRTFPGVFSGIGEFTIHKEFVSSKVAGGVASLTNPALDSILHFAGQAGLLVLLHCDIDQPFQAAGNEPIYLTQMRDLISRHPNTTLIWAHTGLGRVVHPVQSGTSANSPINPNHLELLEKAVSYPEFDNLYFDISWDEVAKYIVASPESISKSAALINAHPERFLFGTDVVAPANEEVYMRVYRIYQPLWEALTPKARELVTLGNYERLFDDANKKVRAWEDKHLNR
ncbi:amidohydrolase family protein [Catalinimonas sp. 4WD22]|uniref:amidohydrolase family protein n=1 Tax=Catalinimonas locisalis TaxID=3133978 RepID=UPI003100DCEA